MEETAPAPDIHIPTHVVSTSPTSDWRYVSEGGATIVFSYIGPPHHQFDGTVLRLKKTTRPQEISHLSNGNEDKTKAKFDCSDIHPEKLGKGFDDPDCECEPDDASIQFQHKVISRLLPSSHLTRLESVNVERSWLEQLSASHNNIRPLERRKVDHVDVERTRAVLATDLVGGDWIAVEIKVCIKSIGYSSHRAYPPTAKMGFPAQSYPPFSRNSTFEIYHL